MVYYYRSLTLIEEQTIVMISPGLSIVRIRFGKLQVTIVSLGTRDIFAVRPGYAVPWRYAVLHSVQVRGSVVQATP